MEADFVEHPSGGSRIRAAMRWKAENLQLFLSKPITRSGRL